VKIPHEKPMRHNSDCDSPNNSILNFNKNHDEKKGYMNNKGVFHFHNGDNYEGEWRNGKMNGWGVYNFLKGDRYEGEYYEDVINGRGSSY
jgi:hypothetical protein